MAASKFNTFNDIDPDDEDRRAHILKLNKLAKYEMTSKFQADSNLSPEEARKQQSFTESLVNKIVDNLQITIRNIHVRFEDRSTGIPLSIGLSLEELSALSTDSDWNPCFIEESTGVTRKLTTLKSLSMYWNTNSESARESDDLLDFMAKATSTTIKEFQYILRPVSGVGHITLNKDPSEPATNAQLVFEDLGFVFDNEQYRDIILVAEEFRKYQQIMEYVRLRPKVPVEKDPKAWFKYAGDVILKQVRDNRKQWTWNYILERRQDKLRYIELYKKRETDVPGTITDAENEEFDLIEKKYPFSDLKFFRSLAKSELKREKKNQPAPEPQSWSSWIWGSSTATKEIAGEVVTEEQENEFYDAIEWDENQATEALDYKSDSIVLKVSTMLKTGSFTLRNDPHGNRSHDIMNVLFNGFKLEFDLRGGGNSFLADLSLQELRVDDGSPDTLFKQVVTVKSLSKDVLPQITHDDCQSQSIGLEPTFFGLTYEHNPLEGTADSNLFLKMQGITVFYNKLIVENVVRFFKPPKSHLQTVGALLNAAGATVEEFRDLTRMGLEYALQKHKTLNLKLDIQAPLIVIPSDITDVDSSCAIFDAGHISVESHLASKEIVEKVQKKQSEQYNEEDWKTLESLMYDRYNVKLHSTQFMIGSSLRNTMKDINTGFENSNTVVIDKVNVDFLVEVSILPEAHNITRFKTSGNLPLLQASISDEKYRILMLIIESSIPHFDSGVDIDDEETIDEFPGISTEAPALMLPDESDDDTSTVVSQKQAANDRQLLDFDFGVDKVSLSLNRCTSESTLEQDLLIDLSLHSFKIDLKVQDDNIIAHASLLDIVIEDHIQKLPPGELTKVVSSSDVNDKADNKLLTLAYNRDNLSGDQRIDLDLLTVKFVVTPKTILSLMDFARSTFNSSPDVNQTATPDPIDQEIMKDIPDSNSTTVASSSSAAGKLDLKIQLRSIIFVLNDDGIKVATFQLDQAQADVELISEDISVHARIGQLSLHDDMNEGVSRNSLLRTLVSLEDNDLAELRYKTFNHTSEPMDYSSMIFFRAGSIRVNLVQEPLARLSTFLSRFSQMKKFYDAARDAAMTQAKQIDSANNIQFDVLISSPIVVLPRLTGPTNCDLLIAHLGDIFARNEFTNSTENNIVAGIRSIKLSSEIGDVPLDVLGNVDLAFNAVYNTDTSVTSVKGFLSDANIKLTELQLEFLLEASSALSSIVSGDSGLQEAEINELGQELGIKGNLESLGLVGNNSLSDERLDKDSNKLSLEFDVRRISVSLFDKTKSVKSDGEELDKFALSKFSLNKTKFSLQIKGNGDINTDVAIKSFTVEDTRHDKDNRFTEIIPAASKSVSNQFIAAASLKEGSNGNKLLKADLTVTNPRIILAIDYLAALKLFSDSAFPSSKPIGDKLGLETIVEEEESGFTPEFSSETSAMPLASETPSAESKLEIEYNVKITDSSVILLSDPKLADTEAIVFKVDLISLSQKDDVIKTNINDVGMFLCRMNRFYDNRLRIIDDFSVCSVLDMSPGIISKVDVSCEALVLRLSLRDVLLALDIFKRASEMASPGTEPNSTLASVKKEHSDNSKIKKLDTGSGNAPTTLSRRRSSINFSGRRPSLIQSTPVAPVMKFVEQRLRVEFEGLRLVIIGTVHELPMLDGCVRPFTVTANNWSGMSSKFFAAATVDTFWNIYNHEKSAWEPLLEPWNVTFEASKPKPDQIAIDVKSDKKAEATVTALTISTLNKALNYFSEDIDFLSKTREKATLYRIENQTGFDIEIWATQDSTTDSTKHKTVVRDGEEIPWNFDDWHTMRENLSVDLQKVELNIKLNGIPFDILSNVSVASIGETLYDLKHSRDGPNGQLVCEVVLTDTVKRVILRSPLTFENETQVPIEMCLDSSANGSRHWTIKPGHSQSVPINHHSREAVSFRPDGNYGFGWSDNPVHWQNLLSRPKAYSCTASANSDIKFFIQFTITNKKLTPAAASGNTYPGSLRVVLTPPIEVTNLLPFNMTYRIYDKSTGKDWKNTLKKGATSAVHVVEPSRLLLLSVHPESESGYDRSDFAVINAPLSASDFSREYQMLLRSPRDGQKLKLNIHYLEDDTVKGNFCRIQIYTPYLILNKTGLDLHIQSRFSTATSKVQYSDDHSAMGFGAPKMWSFERDSRSNRANIKVGNSAWSGPLSFDTLGKDSEVVIHSELGQKSLCLGLHVEKGVGKYHMTKVITLTPRFIIHNELDRDIYINDPGSNDVLVVSAGALHSLEFLYESSKRQLLASFDKKHWSSPFAIENVGRNHLRMFNSTDSVDSLLRINILLEDATLFLHIDDSSKNWPYVIQNYTNHSLTVFQSNPYVDAAGYIDTSIKTDFKPIEYTIPAKTSVPYAWDFPAGIVRELVIKIGDQDRRIQFSEIGTLEPMKLGEDGEEVLDISVVADGPTQILMITEIEGPLSVYQFAATREFRTSDTASNTSKKNKKFDEGNVSMIVRVNLEGMGISLINKHMQELCYTTFRGAALQYRVSEIYETFTMKLKWIQIDNQLPNSVFPILLYPSIIAQDSVELESHPTFSGSVTKVRDDSYGVLFLKHATVLLQQISVQLDEDFVFAFIDFIDSTQSVSQQKDVLCDEKLVIPEPINETSGLDMYFEVLHIQPAQMDLSFVRTTERSTEDEDNGSSQNTLMFFFDVLTMALGNINDAPIRLNALLIENVYIPLPMLYQSIQTHYSQNFFYQMHKLLGSADFLGNPVGLFNNMSSGFMDLFYEPYQGYIVNESPHDLGIGIAKGGLSFMKKSIFGISDSVSKVTGSISKGLSAATMDQAYQSRRNINRARNRPSHALTGIASGANSFVEGITSGVSGLALAPVQGASEEGAMGFFKGLGKGLIGLPTKTAIGLLDMASSVSEGVKNTTTLLDTKSISRIRPPRFIARDGIIRPYNHDEAEAQIWLKTANRGQYYNDQYISHIPLACDSRSVNESKERVVIITYSRIILLNTSSMTTEWEVRFEELQAITMERTGLALTLRGGVQGPFVPLRNASDRKKMYNELGVAVNEFNRKLR